MSDKDPEGLVELDYDLDDVVVADTPTVLKALGHPLRWLILDLVLEKAMTVTELGALTNKPRATVAHHVDALVATGLLRVVRTRKVRAIEERFYGRTARTIVSPPEASSSDLPFFADARAQVDRSALETETAATFTLRHARIPAELAEAFAERLHALTIEFTRLPRSGQQEWAVLVGFFPTNRLSATEG